MKIKLLENYNEYNKGEIVNVTNDEARMLINKGIAKEATNKDFLVKPQFGITKAFVKPTSGRGFKKFIK